MSWLPSILAGFFAAAAVYFALRAGDLRLRLDAAAKRENELREQLANYTRLWRQTSSALRAQARANVLSTLEQERDAAAKDS